MLENRRLSIINKYLDHASKLFSNLVLVACVHISTRNVSQTGLK